LGFELIVIILNVLIIFRKSGNYSIWLLWSDYYFQQTQRRMPVVVFKVTTKSELTIQIFME